MVCQHLKGLSRKEEFVNIRRVKNFERLGYNRSSLRSLLITWSRLKFFSKFFSFLLSSSFLQLISRFLNVIRVVDGNELYVAIGSANNLFAAAAWTHILRITSLLQRGSCYQHAQCMFLSHKNNKNPQQALLRISTKLLLLYFMTEHFAQLITVMGFK